MILCMVVLALYGICAAHAARCLQDLQQDLLSCPVWSSAHQHTVTVHVFGTVGVFP